MTPQYQLDCTTPEDTANGIRRQLDFHRDGTVSENIEMSDPERCVREARTHHEMRLPERHK